MSEYAVVDESSIPVSEAMAQERRPSFRVVRTKNLVVAEEQRLFWVLKTWSHPVYIGRVYGRGPFRLCIGRRFELAPLAGVVG